ncbi:sensor domain-containing protein [Nocardioides zeae]|uniref:Sensor domain-containing protein n=1 Tax=Nocardioides imazamoxiresistens TaxID=3231893 RepID=A0ABU3PU70_9ACTN|nr:sensor domain-containing protein [Nocardioides zeae]MDT9592779.1 sensor domain-containing protein [Nocardioides zeae]
MPERPPDPTDPTDPPDPTERLRALRSSGPAMPALPPHEIRRRGDRRRRRTHAAVAATSLAVVAVVAGGGIALTDVLRGDDRGRDAASTATAQAVRTDVPGAFPLDAGWPAEAASTAVETDPVGTSPDLCGEALSPADASGRAESRTLAAGGEGESDALERTLVAFDDVADARAYLGRVQRAVAGCATTQRDDVTLTNDTLVVATSTEADDSLAVTRTADGAEGGADLLRYYRTENAVLVSRTYAVGFAGDDEALAQLVAQTAGDDAAAVDALRYYRGEDLPTQPPTDGSSDDGGPDGDGQGDDGQGDDGTGDGTGRSVSAAQLVGTDLLPPLDGLGPWEEIGLTDEPTLPCAAAGLRTLGPTDDGYAEFTALPSDGSGAPGVREAAVNSAVLAFDDPAAAGEAYATATGWLEACGEGSGAEGLVVDPAPQPSLVLVDGAEGTWVATTAPAPEACGGGADCDAVRYARQGVVQVGSDLVVLTLSRLGGPTEPAGLDGAMDELLGAAASRAAYGM